MLTAAVKTGTDADADADADAVREILEQITDPEIPVLTIADLGILQDVYWQDERLMVVITPSYSGCPAMQTIREDILAALQKQGYENVEIRTRLAPAWTSDWLSEAGREKLKKFGIAPPAELSSDKPGLARKNVTIACPQCQSTDTGMISEHGSTACKALYKCHHCLEPFDYFKCI